MSNKLLRQDLGLSACALCGQQDPLQSSHIIPRFVFEWLRDTSATGHIRFGEQPNLRIQDGWKPKLLCRACEQRFSTWEKQFSEQVFVPLHNGAKDRFQYDTWLLKFAVSISWRVLTLFKLIGGLDEFPAEMVRAADIALKWWGEFLLGQRPHPGPHEQHIMLVDLLANSSIPNLPPNFNRYLYRAIDMYVAHSGQSAIVYAKMGRIVLFGFIKMPVPWHGTMLHVKSGTLGSDQYRIPESILDFLVGQALKMQRQYQEISPRQQEVIAHAFKDNPTRAAESEVFRAMQQDVAMFGRAAFTETDENSSVIDQSEA